MNTLIVLILIAVCDAQLPEAKISFQSAAQYLNQTTDMNKQMQINDLLAKCSSNEQQNQCDVCSLCQNGAFCRQSKNKKYKHRIGADALSALRELIDFNCYCVPGYTGTYCQIDINECLSMPCSNNSTCIDKINSFECKCPQGFKGEFCEINIDECESSPCLHGSKCIDLIDDFRCECLPGYSGLTCSIDINECEEQPCRNNATCLNLINRFECNCSGTGFEGLKCESNINDCLNIDCQHNSTCIDGINSFECKCQPGFTGTYCEIDIDECLSSPCIYGKCWQNSDKKGFIRRVERLGNVRNQRHINTNDSTSLDVSFEYRFNYERADGYWCECTPGYTGNNCETKINECESNPCGSNGICLDLVNEFKCECFPGYTGPTCKENINECLTIEPCAKQSKCIDLKPDYNNTKLKSFPGYYCDCDELNSNLFKLNQNKHVSYSGMNCTLKLDACETMSYMCKHDSLCESILSDKKQDIKCVCKPGFTGKYCQHLTTIRFDGTYSPDVPIIINDKFHLKFDFRLNLIDNKLPLVYFEQTDNQSTILAYEINVYKRYLSISNRRVNLNEKLAFYEDNNTWHSLEITSLIQNQLKIVYSVPNLHLTEIKTIKLNQMNFKPNSIRFGKSFSKNDYISATCLRDVILNNEQIFISINNNTNIKYGCDKIKNECLNQNYCKHDSKCIYKWFTNECKECQLPFYGEQCHLETTKLGFLNKSPLSPLSSFMTLSLLPEIRMETFRMSFQITRIDNDSNGPDQFLFLTLKQTSPNEQIEHFFILSVDENGYLNLKKILFNLADSSKSLKWSLSNDKVNLRDVSTFKLTLKMSEYYIELTVNNKHVSRFELVEDKLNMEQEAPTFQIEQIKFSNNFILNNSISFLVSDLRVNDVNHEFSYRNTDIELRALNSRDEIKIELIESVNLDLFDSSQNDSSIISALNGVECPLKNCYKLKQINEQEILVKNLTCNNEQNEINPCQRYNSVRRYLFRKKNKAQLNYYFDFDKNVLEENDQTIQNKTLDLNALNKRRILLLRDVDLYSIAFDLNINYLKLSSDFKANLFSLSSFDDVNSNSKFLFGLNLITTNKSGEVLFELFTSKQVIQSQLVRIDEITNVNATFTFNSIELYLNNNTQELVKLSDRNVNLFYRSLLKAYASFQLNLLSNISNINSDDKLDPELSACFSNFNLLTRKTKNQLRKYSLIEQAKSILLVDDFKNDDLNEQCGSSGTVLQFEEQEQRSMLKNDCVLVSKFNVNTNEKLTDYYACKCNSSTDELCPYNFWSKFNDSMNETHDIPETIESNTCRELNEYACFNNGTCSDQTDGYICLCSKYYTGKRCEIFDPCLHNSCSAQSTCIPKATEFNTTISLYECNCDLGYLGKYCTIRMSETCLADPCLNGGTCSNVTLIEEPNKLSYECSCPPGYEGKDCQDKIDLCSLYYPCSNGATCTNLYHQNAASLMYKCSCAKGWKGVNCTVDIDECELMKNKYITPCSGNGQCKNTKGDFKCACNQYQYGKNCEMTHICKQDPYDVRPCQNEAICLVNGDINDNKYVCKCAFGYTGVNCSYPTCDTQPCRHDSTCEMADSTTYECNCTGTGYIGPTCETFINEIECHMFACGNNTCDPNKCDCKSINCQDYISKHIKAKPKEFMYHFILWPLLGIMFALLMVLFSIFLMKMKKSRATHGTYSPSRHELQASRIEFNMDLKRPPEERLI